MCLLIMAICFLGCSTTKTIQPTEPCAIANSARKPVIEYDLGLDAQLASLSEQVAVQLLRGSKTRVGVKGFFDLKGRSGRLEKYLEIEFVNRLIRTGRFLIFASDEIDGIDPLGESNQKDITSKEIQLNMSQNKFNRFMINQIEAYLIGSTVDLQQGVKVSVKLVSSRSGLVFGTASVLIHKDQTVLSLLKNFGINQITTEYNSANRTGEVIKAGENQYVELIPQEFLLYVKQVNYEYNLFTNKCSNAEIFLNDEYRVMKVDDMIALTYDNERYILALRNIVDRTATFTFAYLSSGISMPTDNFSSSNREPFTENSDTENQETIVEQEPTSALLPASNTPAIKDGSSHLPGNNLVSATKKGTDIKDDVAIMKNGDISTTPDADGGSTVISTKAK
jgi:hypothetical protein